MKWIVTALALLCASTLPALAQSSPFKVLSAASTNSTLVRASPSQLTTVVAVNVTTTIYYLKFYDKVTAPICNTDPVIWTIPVPFGAANAGGGIVVTVADPGALGFRFGVGVCITAGIADNDNTVAAPGVAVNLGLK